MPTYHLHLVNDAKENTAVTVRWRCTSCGRFADFSRPGTGEPHATETEYPDDIDIYLGGSECIPALIYVSKETFYGFFTDDEIVAITESVIDSVKAAVFRFNQLSAGVPINHPLLISSMEEFEALGLIASGRANEILTLSAQ